MSIDDLFELDTSGGSSRRSSRMFYNTIGSLEITDEENSSKPSQERPAILKTKTKRYHQQDDKKKFIPGQLSDGLRKAMGLNILDIPEHIYRMRHLGYPPGWLRKAEVKSDAITIFGANNEIIKSNNSNSENNVKYDWEKLYEYPGFNSYKYYDQNYDYCYEKGYMPLQEDCLLENFKSFLRRSQMLGKELTDITEIRLTNSERNPDMDFCVPIQPIKRKPMASSTPSKRNERKRIKLDQERQEVDELSDGELVEDNDEDDDDDDDDVIIMESPLNGNSMETSGSRRDFVTEEGTMLIVSNITEKPSLDRFSEGINEHRLFENLPNVGGTYQKVKDILRKVRS